MFGIVYLGIDSVRTPEDALRVSSIYAVPHDVEAAFRATVTPSVPLEAYSTATGPNASTVLSRPFDIAFDAFVRWCRTTTRRNRIVCVVRSAPFVVTLLESEVMRTGCKFKDMWYVDALDLSRLRAPIAEGAVRSWLWDSRGKASTWPAEAQALAMCGAFEHHEADVIELRTPLDVPKAKSCFGPPACAVCRLPLTRGTCVHRCAAARRIVAKSPKDLLKKPPLRISATPSPSDSPRSVSDSPKLTPSLRGSLARNGATQSDSPRKTKRVTFSSIEPPEPIQEETSRDARTAEQ